VHHPHLRISNEIALQCSKLPVEAAHRFDHHRSHIRGNTAQKGGRTHDVYRNRIAKTGLASRQADSVTYYKRYGFQSSAAPNPLLFGLVGKP
jgi:hypothetical protein